MDAYIRGVRAYVSGLADPLPRRCFRSLAPFLSFSYWLPILLVVDSLQSQPRPGGNATGFATIEVSLGGKWLELLKEIAPRVNRVVSLFNPASAPHHDLYLNPLKVAAASLQSRDNCCTR